MATILTWLENKIPFGRFGIAAIIALIIVGLVVAIYVQSLQKDTLAADLKGSQAQVKAEADRANDNAAAVDQVKVQAAIDSQAAAEALTANEIRIRSLDELQKEIANAPAAADLPASDVFLRYLDSVRKQQAAPGN